MQQLIFDKSLTGFLGDNLGFSIFKLADRMRSMQTNGASKNRDSSCFFFVFFSSI